MVNDEVIKPKKKHLMTFMRDLVTSKLGECQVKAKNTRFATACLYKDVNEIHDKLKCKGPYQTGHR